MRSMAWALMGLLAAAAAGARASDADERQGAEDPHAARVERLLKQRPNDPALNYNLGTMRYQHGRYDNAAESLSAAIASSGPSLQSRASYNLGNTHYRLGQAAEETAPAHAIDCYQKALEDYRVAIRHHPKDLDAKYNYELAKQHLNALKTRQAQQQPAKAQPQNQQAQPQQSEQQQGQPAQGGQPQAAQQGSEHTAQTATEPAEPQTQSQQQALWILDTLKHEERGARAKEHPGPAREADVEQDW